MLVFQFKVALDHQKRIYRNIEILENQTLADLHQTIYFAFDRYDEHLYSFYLTKTAIKSTRSRYNFPEYTVVLKAGTNMMSFDEDEKQDATQINIGKLNLQEKDKLYYLFDYGDCWWHEITLLSIFETEDTTRYPKIVKISGKSPDQYPDFAEDAY
jgi:hypothetical protein